MATTRINFTKAALSKITPPTKPESSKGGVYDTYHDTGEKGLMLMVSNGGAKTFYLYMKVNKTPKRIKIGAFPDMNIDQARKAAQREKGLIAAGIDPMAEKQRQKLEGTLKAFFYDWFIEQHAKKHNKAWRDVVDNFERHTAPLQKKALSAITKDDIRALHNNVGKKSGHYIANRILAMLTTMFNKAIEWGWDGTNPAHGIKKFKEKSRERFLQPDELPRFFESLEAEPNRDMKDYFYMALLTGARKSNVKAMHWRDISLELKTWTIADTKNGSSHVVNLSGDACELLQGRLHTKFDGWVFPSRTSASGHLEEPKGAWKRILQRAGIEDLRIHDLRRTLGSYQAITGANSFVIGKSLGHKSSAATERYARLHNDPVRESVEKATETMMALGRGVV